MKPFRYLCDPLFLLCCGLYAANRFLLKSHFQGAFFRFWFNDVLLLPCALPVVLRVHAYLGWRESSALPKAGEIFAHFVGWSILFEFFGPRVMNHATGDGWDVVAYAAGALVSFVWWHRFRILRGQGSL